MENRAAVGQLTVEQKAATQAAQCSKMIDPTRMGKLSHFFG
jgi:hypothetical protein